MRPVHLFILLSLSATAEAQVYKWTDSQGRLHYGDIPPLDAQNVQPAKLTANIIEVEQNPYEVDVAAKKNPVTLYVFEGCGEGCKRAQDLLDKRGIPYALKNQEADKHELQKLTGDTKVPVIIIGKQTPRRGFLEADWNRILDEAGYPKSNPLAALRKKPAVAIQPPASPPATKPAPL